MSAKDAKAFDLRLVTYYFSRAAQMTETGEQDVQLDDFVKGYTELNKLFYGMGLVFSFIADDVATKTSILSAHLQSAVAEKYEFVGTMMEYEKNEARTLSEAYRPAKNELANGSRTLLRLHRALLFTVRLVDGIRTAGDEDKMSQLARNVYDATLAQYHPWAVKKGVHFAVVTLPKRKKLIQILAGPIPVDQCGGELQAMVTAVQAVYEIVQRLFEYHQLLNLP